MTNEELQPGQEVILTLKVRARVNLRSDAHGVCYRIELERRDFVADARTVWIDPDEIVTVQEVAG